MFNKLKNAFAGKVNKYSGKKDFLEAVCAACALVAAPTLQPNAPTSVAS